MENIYEDSKDFQNELNEALLPILGALDAEEKNQSGAGSQTRDIDHDVFSVLTMTGNWHVEKILQDFLNGFIFEEGFWKIYTCVLSRYRRRLSNREVRSFDRLNKVLKFGKRFYRELIKRVAELKGSPEDLKPLWDLLKLEKSNDFPPPSASDLDRIYQSVSHSLCRLGDLSRYTPSSAQSDKRSNHSHAKVYYRAAITVYPDSGLPCNQLGNLSVSVGDYFYAFFWFLKSQCVGKPFPANNVKKMAMKLFRTDIFSDDWMDCPLGDDDKKEIPKSVRRVILKLGYSYAGFYIYNVVYKRNQGDVKQAGISSIVSDLKKLLLDNNNYPNSRLPPSLLVDLSFLGPMLVYTVSGATDTISTPDGEVFRLTIEIIRSMLETGLHSFEGFKPTPQETVPDRLKLMLPALRIYFDWLVKQFTHEDCSNIHSSSYQEFFSIVLRFVELLRQEHGFKFDSLTAVKTLSGKRELLALEEEKKTLGMVPWDGALNDTPSGLDYKTEVKADPAKFQCQCILFSAIELSRIDQTHLKFDEITQQFSLEKPDNEDISDVTGDATSEENTTITSYKDSTTMPTSNNAFKSYDEEDSCSDDEVLYTGRSRKFF